jgi:hypothetical protein
MHRRAVAASLLSCITLPANIIGLPFGVYTLYLLRGRESRHVFGTRYRRGTSFYESSKPRWWIMMASLVLRAYIWAEATNLLRVRAVNLNRLFRGTNHHLPWATLWTFDFTSLVRTDIGLAAIVLMAVAELAIMFGLYCKKQYRAMKVWSNAFIVVSIVFLIYFYAALMLPFYQYFKPAPP